MSIIHRSGLGMWVCDGATFAFYAALFFLRDFFDHVDGIVKIMHDPGVM